MNRLVLNMKVDSTTLKAVIFIAILLIVTILISTLMQSKLKLPEDETGVRFVKRGDEWFLSIKMLLTNDHNSTITIPWYAYVIYYTNYTDETSEEFEFESRQITYRNETVEMDIAKNMTTDTSIEVNQTELLEFEIPNQGFEKEPVYTDFILYFYVLEFDEIYTLLPIDIEEPTEGDDIFLLSLFLFSNYNV